MDDKFLKGIIIKAPKEGAPDFVKGSVSFKVDEFIQFLKDKGKNGWLNAVLKTSQAGKLYIELDTWEPRQAQTENNPTPSYTNDNLDHRRPITPIDEENDLPF